MQKIQDWFLSSYHSDKTAFYLEIAAAIFSIIASLAMALTAKHPDLRLIYPVYFAGGISGAVACLRRGLVWPLVLNLWFCCVNILGWLRAMEIL